MCESTCHLNRKSFFYIIILFSRFHCSEGPGYLPVRISESIMIFYCEFRLRNTAISAYHLLYGTVCDTDRQTPFDWTCIAQRIYFLYIISKMTENDLAFLLLLLLSLPRGLTETRQENFNCPNV